MGTKRDLDSQAILNAAVELAEERGLENISLLQVAERLGVKPPSLYNHLGGLQEISSGIAKLAISRLGDTIRDAAVGRSKGDALAAIASAYRRFAKENPELYKAILRFHADLDTHRFESKTGFAYLNAIFFRRHRRILVRPILACLAIIAILFAAAVVASVYQPNIKSLVSRPDAILPMSATITNGFVAIAAVRPRLIRSPLDARTSRSADHS